MEGLGGTQVSSEDSMDEGEHSEANSQRKRGLSHGSESEDASERVVRRKMDQEGLKVLVKFKEGHDIKSVGPVALTKFLREKVGEIIRARVHSDGDLMIVCKDVGQQLKALKLKSVCKKEVLEVKKKMAAGEVCRGVIYGIPINEDLGRLKDSIEGGRAISLKRLKAWRTIWPRRGLSAPPVPVEDASVPPVVAEEAAASPEVAVDAADFLEMAVNAAVPLEAAISTPSSRQRRQRKRRKASSIASSLSVPELAVMSEDVARDLVPYLKADQTHGHYTPMSHIVACCSISPVDCLMFPQECPVGQRCLASTAVGVKGSVCIVLYERSCALPSQCDLSGEKHAAGLNFNYTNKCCDTDLCNTAVTTSSPRWTGAALSLCSLALFLQQG
ncbi:unnamed protein product [Leuciscus chuanchicus]